MAAAAAPAAKLSDYEVLDKLGKGSFGSVYKVRRLSDGKVMAWKALNYGSMGAHAKKLIVQEVNLLQKLRHPNIVRFYDRIVDKQNTTLYIIMEYCPNGDLAAVINKCKRENARIPEDVLWKLFSQILLALDSCHNREEGVILHRDVKPGNVFLDRHNNAKLGDWGLARVLGEDSVCARTYVGTPYYMAPEQVLGRPYNEKCDVWALGCLLYEATALRPPFEALNPQKLQEKIKEGKVSRVPPQYSHELDQCVHLMLTVDSKARPSTTELLKLPRVQQALAVKEKRQTQPQPEEGQSKETSLKTRELQVTIREKKLQELEEKLRQKERDLEEREKQLKERETIFNSYRGKENEQVVSSGVKIRSITQRQSREQIV